MALLNKNTSVVAIDIGSSSVKMVQLEQSPKSQKWRLVSWGKEDLASDTIVDGSVMNTGAVTDAIKTLISDGQVKGKQVVGSVSGNAVIIKRITLQSMSMDELEEQIKWEAEQYIPFDINDVNIDVQILEGAHPDPSQMDVLLVAARRDLINENMTLIQQSGLTPVVMDVDSFALANMFKINYPELNDRGVIALINVGDSSVNIHILRDGISVFTRDLAVGGRSFTEELQRSLTVSFEEAERLKLGDDENPMTHEIEQVLASAADSLAADIQRTLDFYLSTSTDGVIDRILLTGGAAKTTRFKGALQNQTGIPVEEADPFREIIVDEREFKPDFLDEVSHQLSIAIGLAIRSADALVSNDEFIEINLTPKKYNRRQQSIMNEIRGVGLITTAVVILCVAAQIAVGYQVDQVRTLNNQLTMQINNNKKEVERVKVLESEKKLLQDKLDAINDLKLRKVGPVRMLDELAINCPDKLQLTSLSETDGRVKLAGVAASSPDISKFMSNLEKSDFFDEVLLNTIEQVEQEGIKLKEFSITTRLIVPSIADKRNAKEKESKSEKKGDKAQ
jgi:type IV pilus assembly protein PilM